MQLQDNEYRVKEMDGLLTITITKEALEKWRDHYSNNAAQFCHEDADVTEAFKYGFYSGKQEVLIDLLKMFEDLEG